MNGLFRVSHTIDLVPDVSIVIPNWNGQNLLSEYFSSVVHAAEQFHRRSIFEVEVIVVDDSSTDGSREWLHDNYRDHKMVKILENEKNLGFLRTVNKGFEASASDLVFLLNNDVQVEHDCIEPLTNHFDDPSVFAVCCRAGRINSERLDGGGKIGRFERGFWRAGGMLPTLEAPMLLLPLTDGPVPRSGRPTSQRKILSLRSSLCFMDQG